MYNRTFTLDFLTDQNIDSCENQSLKCVPLKTFSCYSFIPETMINILINKNTTIITVNKKQTSEITNKLLVFTNRNSEVYYGNKRKTHVRSAVPSRSPIAVK